MRGQFGIALVIIAVVMLVALLALAVISWRRWSRSRALMVRYEGQLGTLLQKDKVLRSKVQHLRASFAHSVADLRRLTDELEQCTGAILVPEWLRGELAFVDACRAWEAQVAEIGGQVPSKGLVENYETRLKSLIWDALSSRLSDDARPSLALSAANIVELMLKNSDLYLDKEKRNYGLQETLRGVVGAAHMQLIAPRPNERYTEVSGVTRTVRSVTCRGLKYADDSAVRAGSVICDPIIEESTY